MAKPAPPTGPTSYLVLATPRSGSTLLGQALNATDLAGDPREHFGHKMGFWAKKWGTDGVRPFVARLIAEGRLHGLRLDHVDGLRDPAQYARRLQEMIRRIGRARRAGEQR